MKPNYNAYINSREWRNKKSTKIMDVGYKCEKCGRDDGNLDAHHLTYERLGNERMSDLQVLCRHCHMETHGEINHFDSELGDPNLPF